MIPLSEVCVLGNSVLLNGGKVQVDRLPGWPNSASSGIKGPPDKSVPELKSGDEVGRNEAEVLRLSRAYFAELEKRSGETS